MPLKFLFIALILGSVTSTTKPPKEKDSNSELEQILPNKLYELDDSSFDYFIKDGQEFDWFVLFYLRTCGHCRRAKTEIEKVLKRKNPDNLRFAEVETQGNVMNSIRFNITGIPYIVILSKGKMLELEKFPNEKNLIEFIDVDRLNSTDYVDIPKKPKFYYVAFLMMKESLDSLKNSVNRMIAQKGYDFKIGKTHLIIFFFLCLGGIIFLEYILISCCCKDDDFEKELLKMKEEREKREAENKEKEGEKENEEEEKEKEEEEEKKEEKEEKKEEKEKYPAPKSGKNKPDLKKE